MPWLTPTLKDTRKLTRDYVLSQLGAKAMIPNSVLRIMSDAMAGLAHLTLLYIDWLSKQLLPDTAETVWLDRHGVIWIKNLDGSKGRKAPTYAHGMVQFTGAAGATMPNGTIMLGANNVEYQTTQDAVLGAGGTGEAPAVALTAGTIGNLPSGTLIDVRLPAANIDSTGLLSTDMTGGVDTETDEQLRERILLRIQKPPMGGDADDYQQWTLSVPGVTRAWAFPQEMGIGTMTVRFMMDELRADNGGFPLPDDCEVVEEYLRTVRPVTVKDLFVVSPIPLPVNMRISYLNVDDVNTRAAITESLRQHFLEKTYPGEVWYRSWTDEGISKAMGVYAYDLIAEDVIPPSNGYMPVLGDIQYG
jgi:uncharacterized phage protein gp47/JayE